MSNFKLCSSIVQEPRYASALGELRTRAEWETWAVGFYKTVYENDYNGLPLNWFEKLTKVLKLVEL